jgi:hypothetical protein
MKSIMLVLALLGSVNARAESLAFYGGKYVAAHRSASTTDAGYVFGADYNFTFVGPLSASVILDHTIYSVPGRQADHITSLLFAPGVSISADRLTVFAGLGVGIQLNVITEWAWMEGNNRISYRDSTPKFALLLAPRAGIDYKISDTMFLGLQGAFHYSKYQREGQSTDLSNVVTPLGVEDISQSFFSAALRVGFNF